MNESPSARVIIEVAAGLIVLAGILYFAYSGQNYVPPVPSPTPTPYFSRLPLPSPGCYYQAVQCFKAPCDPILVCPSYTPSLNKHIEPTPWKETTSEFPSLRILGGLFFQIFVGN